MGTPEEKVQEKAQEEMTELGAREVLAKAQEEARKERMEVLAKLDKDLPARVMEWKAQFPNVPIESIHIIGQPYIYRGLIRSEYLAVIRANKDRHETDEAIASRGLLHPKIGVLDWVQKEAGLPFTLSALVMAASGFEPSDKIGDQAAPVRL